MLKKKSKIMLKKFQFKTRKAKLDRWIDRSIGFKINEILKT
ncbi:hypothetical protein SLEP1_g58431 [Rubroshorea leprosula]|uniref:Ribosomal protein L32 n=1 Tax=Rubroshorea leprosula TaxID=152421 RepID=A0AAV5MTU6_9ROSI|nr:hypothetical protein SLEP1_g58431 [Rubroshorea leprosula]